VVSASPEAKINKGSVKASSSRLSKIDEAEASIARRMLSRRNAVRVVSVGLPEIQSLCSFIKENYSSAGDAWDEVFRRQPNDAGQALGLHDGFDGYFKTQRVNIKTFEKCFVAAGYSGNAQLLFQLLKDTDEFLSRASFKFRLDASQSNVDKHQNGTSNASDRGEEPSRNLDQKSGDEPSKTLQRNSGSSGGGGISSGDECQSLGSASTADTSPPKEKLDAKIFDTNESEVPKRVASPDASPRKSRNASRMRMASLESASTNDTSPPSQGSSSPRKTRSAITSDILPGHSSVAGERSQSLDMSPRKTVKAKPLSPKIPSKRKTYVKTASPTSEKTAARENKIHVWNPRQRNPSNLLTY